MNASLKALLNEQYKLVAELREENKNLKEENQYRESIADVLPEGKRYIAEETIQDLQNRINELVWFEEENKRLKEKIELLDNENMCLNSEIKDREEENKKLNEENKNLKEKIKRLEFDVDAWHQLKLLLERQGRESN